MKRNGSSTFEAYALITFMGLIIIAAGYMIYQVIS